MPIEKQPTKTMKYFDLFPLLRGLESERPGIKDRVWTWMCKEHDFQSGGDIAFAPFNGRISNINLFYFGVGDEYELDYVKEYPEELEHCKKVHPDAFMNYMGPGKGDKEVVDLRLDLNLILHVYQDEIEDMEMFSVLVSW